jgi:hypothetical protein
MLYVLGCQYQLQAIKNYDRMVFIVLFDELDIVKLLKIGRLRWLGHLFRVQELYPCRRLIILKPEGIWHVEKPNLRMLESVEEDLKNMGVRNWISSPQDQEQWRTILEWTKLQGL